MPVFILESIFLFHSKEVYMFISSRDVILRTVFCAHIECQQKSGQQKEILTSVFK